MKPRIPRQSVASPSDKAITLDHCTKTSPADVDALIRQGHVARFQVPMSAECKALKELVRLDYGKVRRRVADLTSDRPTVTACCAEPPVRGHRSSSSSIMSFYPDQTPTYFAHVFGTACAAGVKAAAAVTPPLMILTDSDRIHLPATDDRVSGLYFVPEGPVGSATISIHPATYRFSRWLLKQGHARRVDGRQGVAVSAPSDSQSIHKAAAYSLAFVYVIGRANLDVRAEIVLRYD